MSATRWKRRGDVPREHHYAFEACSLVLKGRYHLQGVIECDRHRHPNLLDLDQSLRSVEQYLHGYLLKLLDQEKDDLSVFARNHEAPTDANYLSNRNRWSFHTSSCLPHSQIKSAQRCKIGIEKEADSAFSCIENAVNELRKVTRIKEKYKQRLVAQNESKATTLDDSLKDMTGTCRSSEDYLLFRLIVILQLCLVRIHEADRILCSPSSQQNRVDGEKCMKENAYRKCQDRPIDDDNTNNIAQHEPHDEESFGDASCNSIQRQLSPNSEEEEEDPICYEVSTQVKNQRNGFSWVYMGLSLLSSTYLLSKKRDRSSSESKSLISRMKSQGSQTLHSPNTVDSSFDRGVNESGPTWMTQIARSSLFLSTTLLVRRCWRVLCMNARLENTVALVEDWCAQWNLMESIGSCGGKVTGAYEQQCRRILQLIPVPSAKSSVWQQFSLTDAGALRFSLIKWAMNMLYASVGTAMQVLSGKKYLSIYIGEYEKPIKRTYWGQIMSHVLMSMTAAVAASYYAVVGPSAKSAEVTQSISISERLVDELPSHDSSVDLLRNTWGMVSLPVVKSLSLQVSRLLKGAAVAERIFLGHLPCFILSQSPCPELVIALKRQRRHQDRRRLSKLNTILESVYDDISDSMSIQSSSRVVNIDDYPKRDVIIHLTGGGFLAHTIAGDVPFLLDWSSKCQAVVLIPEYSLLPDHVFPAALEEISHLYVGLRKGVYITSLGFQPNKIIVTGESSGGNLGAALCVKLCEDSWNNIAVPSVFDQYSMRLSEREQLNLGEVSSPVKQQDTSTIRIEMPDAIMFCCPMLNLSSCLSPSRIFGKSDPILPSSLLRAISDAYIPSKEMKESTLSSEVDRPEVPHYEVVDDSGRSWQDARKNPLVSPLFASDHVLKCFPPTLLYGSSEDPFLDDSVVFNARLRSLGVDSELRATRHMAHAFWGLGTAGFPEAIQAQNECQEWLKIQFRK